MRIVTDAKLLKAIWQEGYNEQGHRQDEEIRKTLEESRAGALETIPFEEVFPESAKRRTQADTLKKEEWTEEQWKGFFHDIETDTYWQTVATIRENLAEARVFNTGTLSLTTTPTCVYALYATARHSNNVEEFSRISRDFAEVFKYYPKENKN